VRAGDEIVQIAVGPQALTVAEVDALLYLPGHPREQLVRALQIPALSPGWQGSFQALLAEGDRDGNAGLTTPNPPPSWPGLRPLVVSGIDRESDSVASVRLADPANTPLPAALPGQYLTLRLATEPGARPILRNYSLSGSPRAEGYRISVKREPHGAASDYLHTRLRAGDTLEVAAPRGTFILRSTDAPVLLISAGVGATPVLAMLHVLAAERSTRGVWWLHGARRGSEHSFASETSTLLASLPRARSHVCYSRPGPDDLLGRDFDATGRLSAPVLTALELPRDAEAYVCGPASFMAEISAALAKLGLDAHHVHTEPFGPAPALTPGIASRPPRPPHPPGDEPSSGPTIEFARSNLAVRWKPGYASLLGLAEACDVPVRWSCRTGVCHTCQTAVVSGTVAYRPEPVEAAADGSALVCCAQPQTDIVLDL
jgi:ferredoxin-NADP reductase